MITEQQVRRMASVFPDRSFMHDYLVHGVQQTDAPAAYHLGVALAAISTVAPPELTVWFAGSFHVPCVWSMLVGESRQERKTTSINIVRSMIEEVDPSLLGVQPGSAEGFVESLADAPIQTIVYGELGSFLKDTERGYLERVRHRMCEAYDGNPMGRQRANTQTQVENPRLTMIAGVTPIFLECHTGEVDWRGGFMARWLLWDARRERDSPLGSTNVDKGRRARLIDQLRGMRDSCPGTCQGFTREAQTRWVKWYKDVTNRHKRPEGRSGIAHTLAGGVPGNVLRLIQLLALDYGEARRGGDWRVGLDVLEGAISLGEMLLQTSLSVTTEIVLSPYGRKRRAVLEAVGSGCVPLATLLQRLDPPMPLRELRDVLEELIAAELLFEADGSHLSACYTRTRPEAVVLEEHTNVVAFTKDGG